MRFCRLLLLLALLGTACGALNPPTPTPTATPTNTQPPTATATTTPTRTPMPATSTPTSTPTETTVPTDTPRPTLTVPPSPIPTATHAPEPTAAFLYDNWEMIEAPPEVVGALTSPYVAFINQNDRESAVASTPQPGTGRQVLYYSSPTGGSRISILEMDVSTGDQVYISPTGTSIAYFRVGSSSATTGLYVVDLNIGISGRILPVESLAQRGFFNRPSWSPDGSQIVVAAPTGYDIDIYTVRSDGSNPRNITSHGSYDFWPQWSPDGQRILFVSDRAICPSWRPGDAGTCDGTDAPAPIGGHLYVVELASGSTTQLSQELITEAPRWLNEREIAYASGDPVFGDPERALFVADVITGQSRRLTATLGPDDPVKISESWSADGEFVLYQGASSNRTEIVMMNANGTPLGRTNEFTFPRYAMRAAWSPDDTRVAIGGANGQCPYGVLVMSNTFDVVTQGGAPPTMCDPVWSPDGRFLAFTGVRARATGSVDGRVDIYVGNSNGQGASNLTANLRGTIMLLGWVGG